MYFEYEMEAYQHKNEHFLSQFAHKTSRLFEIIGPIISPYACLGWSECVGVPGVIERRGELDINKIILFQLVQ